ncbi:MAG: hypothetical protein JXP48_03405 [Acidobacteria bacterium]|nr:hypothetical protein [Acidobacteriota bacterium]
MMTGLAIENAETITLDAKNNFYDGPRNLFRIVVDEFDGTAISAWHIEDRYGEKSGNLGAEGCTSLDTVVGEAGLYLGGRVMTNVYGQALRNLHWTDPKQVKKVIQENRRLKSLLEAAPE